MPIAVRNMALVSRQGGLFDGDYNIGCWWERDVDVTYELSVTAVVLDEDATTA